MKNLKKTWAERVRKLNEDAKLEKRPDNKVRLYAMANATLNCLRELQAITFDK